jgi:hypothetical protein
MRDEYDFSGGVRGKHYAAYQAMMTDKKCREVLDTYEREIPEFQKRYRRTHETELDHVLKMIPQMREMLDEIEYRDLKMLPHDPHREKFMRWLGFMQGVMYAEGVYTIDQMKQHNRPDDE